MSSNRSLRCAARLLFILLGLITYYILCLINFTYRARRLDFYLLIFLR